VLNSNKQPTSVSTKAERSEKDERTGGFWINKDQMGLDEKRSEGTKGQASGREGMWERESVGC